MSNFVVDIEADGPCPGEYSMVSFGVVRLDNELKTTFYGQCRPISDKWIPRALSVSGHSREETLGFTDPKIVMQEFSQWLSDNSKGRPIFFSDNNGFDWQFINYYFHVFLGENPFGFSSRNIGDLYKGMEKNCFTNFKHLRKTKHTHHPVDDAKGNAEALLSMKKMGLNIKVD